MAQTILKIKWIDAWIENEITLDEIEVRDNKVVCTILGYSIWESDSLIAIAAEKVKNIDGTISWRAVTFIPKSLIIHTEQIGG